MKIAAVDAAGPNADLKEQKCTKGPEVREAGRRAERERQGSGDRGRLL